jgi:hypothetical protein
MPSELRLFQVVARRDAYALSSELFSKIVPLDLI